MEFTHLETIKYTKIYKKYNSLEVGAYHLMKKYKYSMGFMNYCSHDPGTALVRISDESIDYIFAEEVLL